jgi:cell division protein FtsI/penicillin-binding protein 2
LIPGNDQYNYLKKFGFGSLTGVDLVGEQTGSLQSPSQWNALLKATAAFGQGISTTVMNLADDYALFANNGKSVQPHLVAYTTDANGQDKTAITEPAGTQIISPTTAAEINSMLVNTVNIGEGKKAGVVGMQVAGKTGTAQVPDGSGGYSTTEEIGSFAGYFPANNPQFVMVVRLNDPKTVNFAESSAAPTFGAIATWMKNYYGL